MSPHLPASPLHRSIRRHLLAGAGIVLLLAGGVGGWAATTQLSGAVIAQGQLVVDSNVKKVQHPTGGVVAELRVRDGVRVKAGDIVLRLDETQTRANLAIVLSALDEIMARRARDEAERDGADTVTFPPTLLARMNDPQVAHIVNGERRLFEIRREALAGQKAQLRERIAQLREEIEGLTVQHGARSQQIEWVKKELEGVNELWKKNLIAYPRVTALERETARLDGERGQFLASIAQARGKVSELELQMIQLDQDRRAEVGRDLADIRAKQSELIEKKIAAEDQLKRVDVRAPQDGVVHQLNVHTVGGVITASEPVMVIVPETEALVIEAKVRPQDIDQVRIATRAVLRFSAFNQRTTPELNGQISRISADVTEEQRTGTAYYTVRISVPEEEMTRLSGLRLVAGMPVEVFIQTGERTVISYLVKPLQDQLMRSFRER